MGKLIYINDYLIKKMDEKGLKEKLEKSPGTFSKKAFGMFKRETTLDIDEMANALVNTGYYSSICSARIALNSFHGFYDFDLGKGQRLYLEKLIPGQDEVTLITFHLEKYNEQRQIALGEY